MTDTDALRRVAVAGVVAAVVVGVVSTLAGFAAFGWDIEATFFGHPEAILGKGDEAVFLFRVAFYGDMLYSYLLLIPLALFIHRRLRDRRPWLADVGLVAALAYIVLGGAGASILATAGSSLLEAYRAAAPADQPAIATSFGLVRDIVYFALWQTIDAITLGTWIFTTGWLLMVDRPRVARLLVPIGVLAWAAAAMTMANVHSVGLIAAGALAALVAWAVWVLSAGRWRQAG